MLIKKQISNKRTVGFVCDMCEKTYNHAGFYSIHNEFYDDGGDIYGDRAEVCSVCIFKIVKLLKEHGVKFRSVPNNEV